MKLRLIPLLLFAITSLLTLKAFDMLLGGETLTSGPPPAFAAEEKNEEKKPEEKKAEEAKPEEKGSILVPVNERPKENITIPKGEGSSQGAIEERVGEKRREVEEKTKELDVRENLLKAAEQRLDEKIALLKQDENKSAGPEEDAGSLKIKNVVVMYETMKTKSAAAIFNTLDMDVMIEVVSRMKPQVTSQIMAAMEPAAAQKLTVELARRSLAPLAAKANAGKNPARSKAKPAAGPQELPRIDTPPAH